MKTKEEILDFLEKNNCNQELINDVKKVYGYYKIGLSYKENGVKFTKLALKQDKARNGQDVYNIALSYKYFGVEFTELALQHEKAKDGDDVYYIAKSYKQNGAEFTELALQQKQAKRGWDVYQTACKKWMECLLKQ